ncbi:MAG TPA: head GIN domain-containing protein [Flavobacteriaceae bacterium]|nr:head GIN domain-containing protein [Flavobacteriaceae bacterium]
MKYYVYILFFVFISCNNEDVGDCWQKEGDMVTEEIQLNTFEEITIHEGISLVIKTGTAQKVMLETGKNLLPEISFKIIENRLIIRNHNTCNFVRPYGITKVYITSPNITSIRNASEQNVLSDGELTFPNLYLQSSGEKTKYLAVGDFNLKVNNENLRIWGNGISNFNIEGTTNNLDVLFSDGDTRFNGEKLIANTVKVKNVSSNDILVYPINSLTGSIHSTGNVVAFNQPPIVEVEELGIGKLIFK